VKTATSPRFRAPRSSHRCQQLYPPFLDGSGSPLGSSDLRWRPFHLHKLSNRSMKRRTLPAAQLRDAHTATRCRSSVPRSLATPGDALNCESSGSSQCAQRNRELLKRMLNYAVACGSVTSNPVAAVKLLRKSNVRRSVAGRRCVRETARGTEPSLQPILLVAYERDATAGGARAHLVPGGHEGGRLEARRPGHQDRRAAHCVPHVARAGGARFAARYLKSDSVFTNPETGKAWNDIRKMFRRVFESGGPHRNLVPRPATQFRDQRAPPWRAGVGVMKMSGHAPGRSSTASTSSKRTTCARP